MAKMVLSNPENVGRFALKLRWAKDNPPDPPPPDHAWETLEAFTLNLDNSGDANRKRILEAAGVAGTEGPDGKTVPLEGNEVAIIFEEDPLGQFVSGWTTVAIVPSRSDLATAWKIPGNLYASFAADTISSEQLRALGIIIFQRCFV